MCLSRSWREKESPSPVALKFRDRAFDLHRPEQPPERYRGAKRLVFSRSCVGTPRRSPGGSDAARRAICGEICRRGSQRLVQRAQSASAGLLSISWRIPRPGGAYVGKGGLTTDPRETEPATTRAPLVLSRVAPCLPVVAFSRGAALLALNEPVLTPPPHLSETRPRAGYRTCPLARSHRRGLPDVFD